jgi:hypothetical protein
MTHGFPPPGIQPFVTTAKSASLLSFIVTTMEHSR